MQSGVGLQFENSLVGGKRNLSSEGNVLGLVCPMEAGGGLVGS